MRVIGITGGIGSGKSRVLSFLEETYDAVVCQADHVAWKLQEPEQVSYEKIVSHFGTDILNEDKTINRKALGEIVFHNEKELAVLNQITHQEVKEFIKHEIVTERKRGTPLFILEAALLLEDGYREICDELWYIYTERQVRRTRLKESRQYSDEKIDAVFASQASEETYRRGCQKVIDNSGTFDATSAQIREAMNNGREKE